MRASGKDGRSHNDLREVPGFLEPSLKLLMPDPSGLVDMDAAVARVADAVQAGRKIAIFGDYDVDGTLEEVAITSLARRLEAAAEASVRVDPGHNHHACFLRVPS